MRTGARSETPLRLTEMEIRSEGFVPGGRSYSITYWCRRSSASR